MYSIETITTFTRHLQPRKKRCLRENVQGQQVVRFEQLTRDVHDGLRQNLNLDVSPKLSANLC